MCPEHTIAFLMEQMKMPMEKAVEYVKAKIAKDPTYFPINTSGAKAEDRLQFPDPKKLK